MEVIRVKDIVERYGLTRYQTMKLIDRGILKPMIGSTRKKRGVEILFLDEQVENGLRSLFQ